MHWPDPTERTAHSALGEILLADHRHDALGLLFDLRSRHAIERRAHRLQDLVRLAVDLVQTQEPPQIGDRKDGGDCCPTVLDNDSQFTARDVVHEFTESVLQIGNRQCLRGWMRTRQRTTSCTALGALVSMTSLSWSAPAAIASSPRPDDTVPVPPSAISSDVPAGAVPVGDTTCSAGSPTKGNAQSKICHLPQSRGYAQTVAELCFASVEAAQAAGFAPPRNL